MLELRNIRKTYRIGDIETRALDGISVAFREREFVAILGPSGSGKTTCLNVIGGLDRYDEGDLIIKGKETKNFLDSDWDAYRNNSIGFVFQSYNLITHLSIVANVELGMTLSGVSAEEKRQRALEVLEMVGLKEHVHKKPNQLSGGQMQRVAIARALANDPEILLCDEPTGALDSATSVQIMELIKKLSEDRLVIMVTHNPTLADRYADRIIRFEDGKIIEDTHPHQEKPKEDMFKLKKTNMSFFTALNLSFNNIKTKKVRTFLTAFASSIGIIGIAVILSLSSGFQMQIDQFQSDAMAEFPVIISQSAGSVDAESFQQLYDEMASQEEYVDSDEVFLYDSKESIIMHTNKLTDEYMDYLKNIDPEYCSNIGYTRIVNMNLVRKLDDKVIPASISSGFSMSGGFTSGTGVLASYPTQLDSSDTSYLEKNYEVLAGAYPSNEKELVLVVDTKNRIDLNILKALGFDTEGKESIKFTDIVGTTFKLVANDDYYITTPMGGFFPNNDYEAMYNSDDSIELKIAAIVRQKEEVEIGLLASGIAYSDDLSQLVFNTSMESKIVKAQREADTNIITGEAFEEEEKEQMLAYLGGIETPYMIMVYPKDFDSKESVLKYLDEYNVGKAKEDQVIYTDMAGTISGMTSGIMDAITIVLVAFAAISLVVSLIMICIITYVSVLERTREIGILRALGARKKDITRVFDAETCIIGVLSGLLGVVMAYLLTIPINMIIYSLTDLSNVAQLNPLHALLLLVISTALTMLGGHIPAKMASKKDAVEALRAD